MPHSAQPPKALSYPEVYYMAWLLLFTCTSVPPHHTRWNRLWTDTFMHFIWNVPSTQHAALAITATPLGTNHLPLSHSPVAAPWHNWLILCTGCDAQSWTVYPHAAWNRFILHSRMSHWQWTASNFPRCNPVLGNRAEVLLHVCSVRVDNASGLKTLESDSVHSSSKLYFQ